MTHAVGPQAGSGMASPLTIACISVIGGTALEQCARSIIATGFPCLIIADSVELTPALRDIVKLDSVDFIDGAQSSVPSKRNLAVEHARSDWIALVEDSCTLDARWCVGIKQVLAQTDVKAAAGPVNLGGSLHRRARALYCSDYGPFFPASIQSQQTGEMGPCLATETLPGVNLLYHRETLLQYVDQEGVIESEINRRMTADGHRLCIHEDLSVTLRFADESGASFRSRFNHGRLYGGLQSRSLSVGSRLTRGLGCFLLPLVLSLRSIRSLTGTREHIVGTAAWIVMFETVWSCGEFTGYLLGCGETLADWQ